MVTSSKRADDRQSLLCARGGHAMRCDAMRDEVAVHHQSSASLSPGGSASCSSLVSLHRRCKVRRARGSASRICYG